MSSTLARLLPEQLVDKHAQLLFLPMTLRVVNDPSGPCRAAATEVLSTLAKRVRHDTFGMLADFSFKWLKRDVRCEQDHTRLAQEMALLRTGSQVVSIFVGSRPDLIKKGGRVRLAVGCVGRALNALVPLSADFSLEGDDTDGPPDASSRRRRQKLADMSMMEEAEGAAGTEEWAIVYYLLLLLEALFNHLPSSTDRACCQTIESSAEAKRENGDDDHEGLLPAEGHENEGCLLMLSVFEAIVFPHSWVRAAASRVLKFYVSRRDVSLSQQQQRVRLSTSSQASGSGDDSAEALLCPNALYQLGRRLCVALNQPLLAPAHLDALVTDIIFVVRTMARNPHLALVRPTADNDEDGDDCQGDIEGVRPNVEDRDEDEDGVDIVSEDDDKDENGDEVDDHLDGGSDDECEPKGFVSPLDGAVGEGVDIGCEKETAASGANWMMQRLRGIGADPRGRRRLYVIQACNPLIGSLLLHH